MSQCAEQIAIRIQMRAMLTVLGWRWQHKACVRMLSALLTQVLSHLLSHLLSQPKQRTQQLSCSQSQQQQQMEQQTQVGSTAW
jgi:hypothetical protein